MFSFMERSWPKEQWQCKSRKLRTKINALYKWIKFLVYYLLSYVMIIVTELLSVMLCTILMRFLFDKKFENLTSEFYFTSEITIVPKDMIGKK